MSIRTFIIKIKNLLNPPEPISNDAVLGFLRVLESAEKEEISCEELFEKLDQYVEREVDKKDAAKLMPVIREHLDLCPGCCEEYEALLDVVEKTAEK